MKLTTTTHVSVAMSDGSPGRVRAHYPGKRRFRRLA